MELTQGGKAPLRLPSGEARVFLEDGDEVTLRGRCERQGVASLGFGDCSGLVRAARTKRQQ
jgi:fumarylacetoacetase